MTDRKRRDELFAGVRVAQPGNRRSAVLESALAAFEDTPSPIESDVESGVIDRLWLSRPLRVAWATAVVALLVGHGITASPMSRPGSVATPTRIELAEQHEFDELTDWSAHEQLQALISKRSARRGLLPFEDLTHVLNETIDGGSS